MMADAGQCIEVEREREREIRCDCTRTEQNGNKRLGKGSFCPVAAFD